MKKNLLIALIAAASIAPVAANAQAYLGATGGVAHQKATSAGDSVALKDHDTSFEFFGGYQFHKNFGLQAGYVVLNKLRIDSDPVFTIAPNTVYLASTVSYPINKQFAITGKLGVASTRTTFNASKMKTREFRNNTAVVGFGLTYVLTPEITAVAEYENFGRVVNQDGAKLKADNLAVGFRVNF